MEHINQEPEVEFEPGSIEPGEPVRILQDYDKATGTKRFAAAKVIQTKASIEYVLIEYCGGDRNGEQVWWEADMLDVDKNGGLVSFGGDDD